MKNPAAALLILLALAAGCAGPRPVSAPIEVKVTSSPRAGVLYLAGKPLGETPRSLTVDSLESLLSLTAASGSEQVVEERIRILSAGRAEVDFVFGDAPTATAKALGLARILVFDYGAAVTFELNKSDLKPDFLPVLDRQAALLNRHFKDLTFFVCGHTDALGTQEFNLALSLARARSVAEALEARGVPRDRMKIEGFGSAYPVAANQTEQGRAQNRRTELVLPR